MKFHFLDPYARLCRQSPESVGPASNVFSTQRTAGDASPLDCHRCQCQELYDQVMARVLRVKNLCSDAGASCSVQNFAAFRRRNRAISADYARIYMQPTGEAKRLKFAGGAALGSTHIGYAMDAAASVMASWGSNAGFLSRPPALVLEDGRRIIDDNVVANIVDWQELVSRQWLDLGFEETKIGLRRLVYGNLVIYMDLGAVLHFCQMHETRFGFFKAGKVDEFIECFDLFVAHVKDRYANEHPVYDPQGAFGSYDGGFLRNGLRALARNDIEGALTIIDHEQRHILENYMYRPTDEFVPQAELSDLEGTSSGDDKFSRFMNALDRVIQVIGNRNGPMTELSGIRALLSASQLPYVVQYTSNDGKMLFPISQPNTPQPFIFHFPGGDFTDPNVRTPWFKNVVRHFVRAENEDFRWPSGGRDSSYWFRKPSESGWLDWGEQVNPANPPKLKPLLYAEIRSVMGAG